jgi:dTMP kinase
MAGLASFLGRFDALSALKVDRESLALWVDSATFLASALLITSLRLPRKERSPGERVDWSRTWRELVEGIRFVRNHDVVRSVILALGVGLMGCGAVVPLGPIYAKQLLGADPSSFGLLMTGLGFGGAIGVLALSAVARRLPTEPVFVGAILATGVGLILASSVSSLTPAVFLTGLFGMGAGVAYVSGFTLIQERVSDEMRGRTFATLYTIIRFCLLFSLAVSPWLSGALDSLSRVLFDDRIIDFGIRRIAVPGVRLTLWLGGAVTVGVALLVSRDMLRTRSREPR